MDGSGRSGSPLPPPLVPASVGTALLAGAAAGGAAAQQSAAAASLSAAAAMMGKQRLSSMFTSSVFKKPSSDRTKGSSLAVDSIVDDVIAEFAPDEHDREERWRRVGRVYAPPPPPPPIAHLKAEMVAIDAEMAVRSDNGFEADGVSDHGNDMDVELKPDAEAEPKLEATPGSSAELVNENKSSEELKQDANGEVKIEKVHCLNAKIKAEESRNGDMTSATAGWMKICGEGENAGGEGGVTVEGSIDVDESSEFELKDGALPFYILDAYEEPFGVNSGTVYLFGKVKSIPTLKGIRVDRDPHFVPTIPERYNRYAVTSDGSTSEANAVTMDVFRDDLATAITLAWN